MITLVKFIYWSFIFLVGGTVFVGLILGNDWNSPEGLWFGGLLVLCIPIAHIFKKFSKYLVERFLI